MFRRLLGTFTLLVLVLGLSLAAAILALVEDAPTRQRLLQTLAVVGLVGRGLPSRQRATLATTDAVPVAGTVKVRLGTSRPALSCSTRSHEPNVNLNSIGPRTVAGSVMAYCPPDWAAKRYSAAAGFHWLNEPAT